MQNETKNQDLQENSNLLFAQLKFGRVISEASSELPGLTKAEL